MGWNLVYTFSQASAGSGAPGQAGPPGIPGSRWSTGQGPPSVSNGNVNDLYLDTLAANVYQKLGNSFGIPPSWVIAANIKGSQGKQGIQGRPGVGSKGDSGPIGPNGIPGSSISINYNWNPAFTNSQPGSGFVEQNSAGGFSGSTQITASVFDIYGNNWGSVIGTFGDSTNTIKGYLRLVSTYDSSRYALYSVSAVSADLGNFRRISVSYLSSFTGGTVFRANENVTLIFDRVGDVGTAGTSGISGLATQGPPGVPGATWLIGTTAPQIGQGKPGDFYFQTTQTGGGAILIPGPAGRPGTKGDTGPQGPSTPQTLAIGNTLTGSSNTGILFADSATNKLGETGWSYTKSTGELQTTSAIGSVSGYVFLADEQSFGAAGYFSEHTQVAVAKLGVPGIAAATFTGGGVYDAIDTTGPVNFSSLSGASTVSFLLYLDGNNDYVGAVSPTALPFMAKKRVSSDVTTTSSTMADVTGLSFPIAANEIWSLEANLYASGSVGGIKFQITGPSSPTNVLIFTQGDTTGVGAVSTDSQSAFSTPTQSYISGVFSGYVRIMATIENGANAGTISIQFASAVNTQSNTIKRGSFLTANSVA